MAELTTLEKAGLHKGGDERGFTFVELLLIVAIIAILSAATIPLFAVYRQRSYDGQTVSDLKNAAMAEEAYFTNNSTYTDCIGTSSCESVLPNFRGTVGSNVSMFDVPAVGSVPEYFTGRAFNPAGTRNSISTAWQWNSSAGGLQP